MKIRHQKFLYTFFQLKRGVDGDPRDLTGDQGGLWKPGRMMSKYNVHPELTAPSLLLHPKPASQV